MREGRSRVNPRKPDDSLDVVAHRFTARRNQVSRGKQRVPLLRRANMGHSSLPIGHWTLLVPFLHTGSWHSFATARIYSRLLKKELVGHESLTNASSSSQSPLSAFRVVTAQTRAVTRGLALGGLTNAQAVAEGIGLALQIALCAVAPHTISLTRTHKPKITLTLTVTLTHSLSRIQRTSCPRHPSPRPCGPSLSRVSSSGRALLTLLGTIGDIMNIVRQPRTLRVRGRNAGMGTAAGADYPGTPDFFSLLFFLPHIERRWSSPPVQKTSVDP